MDLQTNGDEYRKAKEHSQWKYFCNLNHITNVTNCVGYWGEIGPLWMNFLAGLDRGVHIAYDSDMQHLIREKSPVGKIEGCSLLGKASTWIDMDEKG